MELGALVSDWLAAHLGLAGTELAEVFGCFGDDVGEKLHLNAAKRFAAEGHVEEDDRIRFVCHGGDGFERQSWIFLGGQGVKIAGVAWLKRLKFEGA